MTEKHRQGLLLTTLSITLSALVWFLLGRLNQALSTFTAHSEGIDLVYLPAGFRLFIILIFRLWGAIGIALASPLLFQEEFSIQPFTKLAIDSLITGLVPLLTVIVLFQVSGIDRNLKNFRAVHLLVIALAVSITTPLIFNVSYILTGLKIPSEFWNNLSAMILGDFIGCVIVVFVFKVTIQLFRKYSGTRFG